MTQLRTRVQRLEASARPVPHTGCIRIIQNGDLSQRQKQEIAAADESGKLVIVRRMVSAGTH